MVGRWDPGDDRPGRAEARRDPLIGAGTQLAGIGGRDRGRQATLAVEGHDRAVQTDMSQPDQVRGAGTSDSGWVTSTTSACSAATRSVGAR